MQVRAHQRLHRVDVQHPSGFQAGPRRTHRQRGEQALQQVRGMDEVRQAEALATQRQQRIELRQQARLHAQAQARGAAQRTQEILRQSAFEMYPVDAPGPLRVGAVGMFPALAGPAGRRRRPRRARRHTPASRVRPGSRSTGCRPARAAACGGHAPPDSNRGPAGSRPGRADGGPGRDAGGRRDETHTLVGQGQAEVCTERFTATRLGSLNPKIVHPLRKIVNPQAACGRL